MNEHLLLYADDDIKNLADVYGAASMLMYYHRRVGWLVRASLILAVLNVLIFGVVLFVALYLVGTIPLLWEAGQ